MPPKPIPRDHPVDDHQLIDPFLADVMSKMLGDTASISKQVDDNYRAEIAELRATIDLIREGVSECFDGPYVPQAHVVLKRLYPDPKLVKEEAKARRDEEA
jgi:hypothetical protein